MPSRTQSAVSGSSVGLRRSVGDSIGIGIGQAGAAPPIWELRLNFVQPAYELTNTAITEPRLRLNFVQDDIYSLRLNTVAGAYSLDNAGSDGFYIARN